MDSGSLIIFSFPLVGMIFIALGLPLKLGKIRPNNWYGFRTAKSLANEATWYMINRKSGEDMIKVGVMLSLCTLLMLLLRVWITAEVAIGVLTGVLLAAVAWMAIRGLSLLKEI